MLEIGGRPVLHHVMEIYARQGFGDFLLATGYKGEVIASWAASLTDGWRVECLDTGDDAGTGDRLRSCAEHVGERFLATYGDGLGNVDVTATVHTHETRGADATVTVVPLRSQYGTIDTDANNRVTAFREKPVLSEHWINAGYFVLEPAAMTSTPGTSLEQDVLPALADSGKVYVYRHEGFWRSMDTHKDVMELNALADEEGHPWLQVPTV